MLQLASSETTIGGMTRTFGAVIDRAENDCPEQTETEEGGRRLGELADFDAAESSQPTQLLGVGPRERALGLPCGRTYSKMAQNAKGRARWAWMQGEKTTH